MRRRIVSAILGKSRPAKMASLESRKEANRRRSSRNFAIEALERRDYFAGNSITIFAAGETNEETMQLRVDGQAVQTWTNVGGNVPGRQFQALTYTSPTVLTPDRVRVAFTNDLFVPSGKDRNLVVDRIVLGTTTYQTEAPSVFSTGTWRAQDQIQPGFRQSEILHADGYFQYAINTGSLIQIIAAGQTGNENMSLRINDQEVSAWNTIGGNAVNRQFNEFTYRAAGPVVASQIRVALTNDLYAPPIDNNLRIDKIIVDGIEYESEAPSVFSNATYQPSLGGFAGGYWQSEWLDTDGYFQYDARVVNAGTLGLETSVYAVREGMASINVAVVRSSGSDGTVSIQYKTNDGTAIAGQDYTTSNGTIVFNSGETRKTVSIPILNNTIREAPETFSFVIENPSGGATLLAPRTATITITDDDLVLPSYATFPNTSGLTLNGNASVTGNAIRVTPNTANQAGAAFYTTPIPINVDTSFQTRFQLRATGGTSGADGMAFVIQNSTAGPAALGTTGGGLGYGGIGKSLAIEFDTYQNAGEINGNHTSIWVNGVLTNSLSTRTSSVDFNSGTPFNVWVDYNGDGDLLAFFLSSGITKPTSPVATVSVNLAAILGSQAYFGFTAGTGGLANAHEVVAWNLNLDRPTVAPPEPVRDLVQETVVSGLTQPIAIDFSPDGRNMYIAQKSGLVAVVRDGQRLASPFIDIRNQVNDVRDRGLLDIALHPNFASNPYVYLLFTYDPPEVNQNVNNALAGPDKPGNRAGRLLRVTADASTNYTTVVPGSEVILLGKNSTWNNFNAFINSTSNLSAPQAGLNPDGSYVQDFIPTDSESHTVGSLAFSSDGSLFVSIGDGASYNSVDARATRVQSIDSLSGKLLRINPITGQGYANNPFANADLNSNRSKVYQLGLRNPFRITTNPTTGQPYIGDVGWTQWEEINAAGPGANFGWPYFEGGSGSNLRTGGYQNLTEAQTFYASGQVATPAIYALNHAADGINAIVMGAYYTGSAFPSQYQNNLFFNDLGQGIVRNATIDATGRVTNVETFATGAVYVVQIVQGRDGNLYYVDLDDGTVGRWKFVAPTTPAVARSAATPTTPVRVPITLGQPATSLGKGAFLGVGAANVRTLTRPRTLTATTASPLSQSIAPISTSVIGSASNGFTVTKSGVVSTSSNPVSVKKTAIAGTVKSPIAATKVATAIPSIAKSLADNAIVSSLKK